MIGCEMFSSEKLTHLAVRGSQQSKPIMRTVGGQSSGEDSSAPEPHSLGQGRSQPPNVTNANLLETYGFHSLHCLRGSQPKINVLSTFSRLFPAQASPQPIVDRGPFGGGVGAHCGLFSAFCQTATSDPVHVDRGVVDEPIRTGENGYKAS